MIYVIIPLLACAIGLSGFLAHRRFSAFERTLTGRLDLVLRASRACANKVCVTDKKIERLHHDQRVAFMYQKKALDHHRVLLASLHRQVRQLEMQIQSGNTGSTAAGKAANDPRTMGQQPSATTQAGKILKQTEAGTGNLKSGVIRLEEMFEAMPPSPDVVPASRNVDPEKEFAKKIRRIAHG